MPSEINSNTIQTDRKGNKEGRGQEQVHQDISKVDRSMDMRRSSMDSRRNLSSMDNHRNRNFKASRAIFKGNSKVASRVSNHLHRKMGWAIWHSRWEA